jgi:hypothetical protein
MFFSIRNYKTKGIEVLFDRYTDSRISYTFWWGWRCGMWLGGTSDYAAFVLRDGGEVTAGVWAERTPHIDFKAPLSKPVLFVE